MDLSILCPWGLVGIWGGTGVSLFAIVIWVLGVLKVLGRLGQSRLTGTTKWGEGGEGEKSSTYLVILQGIDGENPQGGEEACSSSA
jgi:hypothetical protein